MLMIWPSPVQQKSRTLLGQADISCRHWAAWAHLPNPRSQSSSHAFKSSRWSWGMCRVSHTRGVDFWHVRLCSSDSRPIYKCITDTKSLKHAATPFVPDGSVSIFDEEAKGELAPNACRIFMKVLWLGRLSRPDLIKPINDVATKVQSWSRGMKNVC